MSTLTVRDVLLARAADNTARHARKDPWHLALVIEGGGMRGVVGGGMVTALEARGLLNAFDSIHGSSAGACNAAYFVAGQARMGTSIYYEDINNSKFINPLRPLYGRPIMDKDFLIDRVMHVNKPLDVDKILGAPGLLHIIATDVFSGEGRIFGQFRNAEHFFRILKGTICMPVIAGQPVEVDGCRILDGGLVQQIPIRSAIDVGATHILVLIPRRKNELQRRSHNSPFHVPTLLVSKIYGPMVAERYRRQNDDINAELLQIASGRVNGAGIQAIVRGAHSVSVGRLTINSRILKQADIEAQKAIFDFLDGV